MTKKIALILVSIWWGWTVIIDFAVVPTVFKVINDFFNAGELGIALFSKLNTFEMIVSTLLIVVSVFHFKNSGRGKIQLGLAVAAWMIVMFYFAYLTPKIIHLTDLWKQAETVQKLGIAGINDIQLEHQFYHRMYVGLDSLKLLILSFLLGNDVLRKT
jgi:hypothetical protein